MNPFEAVELLLAVRDRLRRQIRLEEYYRRGQPKEQPDPLVVFNGALYALAPRAPSRLRREIAAIEQAIAALRPRTPRLPRTRRRREERLVGEVVVEGVKEPNPFAPEKKRCPRD